MSECPEVRSCLLCDTVIIEELTKKPTLVGVFSNINVETLPAIHVRGFTVFLEVTNIIGTRPLTIRISGPADTNHPEGTMLLKVEGELAANDPSSVAAIHFEMREFPIRDAGRHRIDCLSKGERCGGTWFMVTQKEQTS